MKPAKSHKGVPRFRVEREEADRAIVGYRLISNNEAVKEVKKAMGAVCEYVDLNRDDALLILAGNIALHNAAPELPSNRTDLHTYEKAEKAKSFFGDGATRTIVEGTALLLETPGTVASSPAA